MLSFLYVCTSSLLLLPLSVLLPLVKSDPVASTPVPPSLIPVWPNLMKVSFQQSFEVEVFKEVVGLQLYVNSTVVKEVKAGQLGQALSFLVDLDPCSSHQELYGQLITKKVQHRRYSVPASYTPAWSSLRLIKEWLNKSLCIDGTNLRSQFRLHSLARDTLDSFFQADNSYRQPEEDEASGEQNLQPSIGDNNRSTNINNVENLVGEEVLLNCFKRLEFCFEETNNIAEKCRQVDTNLGSVPSEREYKGRAKLVIVLGDQERRESVYLGQNLAGREKCPTEVVEDQRLVQVLELRQLAVVGVFCLFICMAILGIIFIMGKQQYTSENLLQQQNYDSADEGLPGHHYLP